MSASVKPALSTRQTQVAVMVRHGYLAKQIADETGLALKTVREHIYEAAAKIPGNSPPMRKLTLWVLNAEQP